MQGAAFKDGQPTDARRLEGRITRIAYRTNPGPSILEVSRNFETQLAKAGFETLLACDTDACGGIPFAESDRRAADPADVGGRLQLPLLCRTQEWTAGARPMPASSSARTTAKSIPSSSSPNSARSRTRWWTPPSWPRVSRDTGRIALYGIYFDTDRAEVKPESRPTLEQIAKLLTANVGLSVFIVGHTDNQGPYAYNLDLSRRRAEAIAAELVKNYAIGAPRLRTAGVGFLAPVGSNANDAGRALNRRVELVAP